MKQVEKGADTARRKLPGLYTVAGRWFKGDDFFGCMYIKAISEHSDLASSFRDVCKQFKTLMRNYLQELCEEANPSAPTLLVDQLALLLRLKVPSSPLRCPRTVTRRRLLEKLLKC